MAALLTNPQSIASIFALLIKIKDFTQCLRWGQLMSNLLMFAAAAAAVLAIPGPTNTVLAASGALAGVRRSLPLIFAALGGYGLSITILISLSGPILSAFPRFWTGLVSLLGLYLLLLAWRLWGGVADAAKDTHGAITVREVFIATLLNPKALILAFVVFPPLHGVKIASLYTGAVATIIVIASAGWIAVGASIGHLASRRDLLISRASAIVLVMFACGMAYAAIAR
jgi:threonine/homoserine/homoserine lactone efflux protein